MYYKGNLNIFEDLATADITDEYDDYLSQHISNVEKGYKWLKENLPELFEEIEVDLDTVIKKHDESKYSEEEYLPYAEYFYGKRNEQVDTAFDYAWLHHQKIK